jgi:hypothetical protein
MPHPDHAWENWLTLPVRLANALRNAGKHTLRQVADMSPFEVLQLRGVGKTCLRDLKTALAEYHLDLRPNDRQRAVAEVHMLRSIDRVARLAAEAESLAHRLRDVQAEMVKAHADAVRYEKGP